MILSCAYIENYLSLPQTLSWKFHSASAQETENLGDAFAAVVGEMQTQSRARQKIMRIGLMASMEAGKTTLARAILKAFPSRFAIEQANSQREQNLWDCGPDGFIRHYDAALKWDAALPSYFANDNLKKYGFPFVDLVEHPKGDKNNQNYNCLIYIKSTWRQNEREIHVIAPPSINRTQGFRDFLSAAECLPAQNVKIAAKERAALSLASCPG